ncbi:MAG: response regulator transcription factor [Clostridia bacterium]|nr:response regulator transcription factor [Clostridia bacterium]
MITIAIVEDDKNERERIKECLDYVEENEGLSLRVSEFSNGLDFLGGYKPVYDIVLMDIEMPGMDGIELARAIRKVDKSVILIFVTNLAQYAVQGYEVEALDFILKPINKFSFAMKLDRAIARTTKRMNDSFQIKTGGETLSVQVASVRYVEVDAHYVIYHTTEGDYTEYKTLKEVEKKINKEFFARCNRCYLVNLRYVTSVKKDTVFVGKDELIISRPQKKAFLSAFSDFLGGRK